MENNFIYDSSERNIAALKTSLLYFDKINLYSVAIDGGIPFFNLEPIADVLKSADKNILRLQKMDTSPVNVNTSRFDFNPQALLSNIIDTGILPASNDNEYKKVFDEVGDSYRHSKIFSQFPMIEIEPIRELILEMHNSGPFKREINGEDFYIYWTWWAHFETFVVCKILNDFNLPFINTNYIIDKAINKNIEKDTTNSTLPIDLISNAVSVLLPDFEALSFDDIFELREKCNSELTKLRYYIGTLNTNPTELDFGDVSNIVYRQLKPSIEEFQNKVKGLKMKSIQEVIEKVGAFSTLPIFSLFIPTIPTEIALSASAVAATITAYLTYQRDQLEIKKEPLYFTLGLKKEMRKIKK